MNTTENIFYNENNFVTWEREWATSQWKLWCGKSSLGNHSFHPDSSFDLSNPPQIFKTQHYIYQCDGHSGSYISWTELDEMLCNCCERLEVLLWESSNRYGWIVSTFPPEPGINLLIPHLGQLLDSDVGLPLSEHLALTKPSLFLWTMTAVMRGRSYIKLLNL